jgi:hypothetical protein
MMVALCPHCRGPVEPERLSRRLDDPGIPVLFCPACDLVVIVRPTAYEPAERRDLA